MTKTERIRHAFTRIARAESECNATILRALDKLMRVLERERLDVQIRKDREDRQIAARKTVAKLTKTDKPA